MHDLSTCAIPLDFYHKIGYKYDYINEISHSAYMVIQSQKREDMYWQANAKGNEVKLKNARSASSVRIGFWMPRQN